MQTEPSGNSGELRAYIRPSPTGLRGLVGLSPRPGRVSKSRRSGDSRRIGKETRAGVYTRPPQGASRSRVPRDPPGHLPQEQSLSTAGLERSSHEERVSGESKSNLHPGDRAAAEHSVLDGGVLRLMLSGFGAALYAIRQPVRSAVRRLSLCRISPSLRIQKPQHVREAFRPGAFIMDGSLVLHVAKAALRTPSLG